MAEPMSDEAVLRLTTAPPAPGSGCRLTDRPGDPCPT